MNPSPLQIRQRASSNTLNFKDNISDMLQDQSPSLVIRKNKTRQLEVPKNRLTIGIAQKVPGSPLRFPGRLSPSNQKPR